MLAVISFPILERIPVVGDFALSPHGISIAAGFLLGALLMLRRVPLRGIAHRYVPDLREEVQQILGRALVGAIIGARLFYVLTRLDVYVRDPVAILRIWEGGLTLLGGLVGAILLGMTAIRARRYSAWLLLDSAMPGIALGIFVGRIGDLVIGEHLGPPAPGLPIAWQCTGNYWVGATNSFGYVPPQPYPYELPTTPIQGCFDVAVHQTALYDFAAGGLVLALLLWLERKPRFDGFFVAAFVYGYGAIRFATDFVRDDRVWLGLTGTQWTLLGAMALVTAWLVTRRPWRQHPWAWDRSFEHPWLRPPEDAAAAPGDAANGAPTAAKTVASGDAAGVAGTPDRDERPER